MDVPGRRGLHGLLETVPGPRRPEALPVETDGGIKPSDGDPKWHFELPPLHGRKDLDVLVALVGDCRVADGVPHIASDHRLQAMPLSALLGKAGPSRKNEAIRNSS
jgi:hypothetical protein